MCLLIVGHRRNPFRGARGRCHHAERSDHPKLMLTMAGQRPGIPRVRCAVRWPVASQAVAGHFRWTAPCRRRAAQPPTGRMERWCRCLPEGHSVSQVKRALWQIGRSTSVNGARERDVTWRFALQAADVSRVSENTVPKLRCGRQFRHVHHKQSTLTPLRKHPAPASQPPCEERCHCDRDPDAHVCRCARRSADGATGSPER